MPASADDIARLTRHRLGSALVDAIPAGERASAATTSRYLRKLSKRVVGGNGAASGTGIALYGTISPSPAAATLAQTISQNVSLYSRKIAEAFSGKNAKVAVPAVAAALTTGAAYALYQKIARDRARLATSTGLNAKNRAMLEAKVLKNESRIARTAVDLMPVIAKAPADGRRRRKTSRA